MTVEPQDTTRSENSFFSAIVNKLHLRESGLVWTLAVFGLSAMLLIFIVISFSLRQIAASNRDLSEMSEKTDLISIHLNQNLRTSRAHLFSILDQTEPPTSESDWLGELVKILQEYPENGFDSLDVRQNFSQFTSHISKLSELRTKVYDWYGRNSKANENYQISVKKVTEAFNTLRAAVATAEGLSRLKRIKTFQKIKNTDTDKLHDFTSDLFSEKNPSITISSAKSELADLALLCERLQTEKNIDLLSDLKDNLFSASLSRLSRDLSNPYFQNSLGNFTFLLDDFEVKLFGQSFHIDAAHQTILTSKDGLYEQRGKLLSLAKEKEKLKYEITRRFNFLQQKSTQIHQGFDTMHKDLALEAESAMSISWIAVLIVFSISFFVFLLLSKKIANLIFKQNRMTESAHQDLEHSLEIVRLLQKIAIAANQAQTAGQAIRSILSLISRHGNWAIGHAVYKRWGSPSHADDIHLWSYKKTPEREHFEESLSTHRKDLPDTLIDRIYATKRRVWIDASDPLYDLTEKKLLWENGIRTLMAFPVIHQSQVIAIFEFFSKEVKQEDTSTVQLLKQASTQIARSFEREWSEKEKETLNRDLIRASREAGKAEVATGVLHNVGNVLNSVNISASIIREKIETPSLNKLNRAITLLHEHKSNLANFFIHDPRGNKLGEYLEKIASLLEQEHALIREEASGLSKKIDHIKSIVSFQQTNAKKGNGIIEATEVKMLFEEALHLFKESMSQENIEIVKEFDNLPLVPIDRQKMLQILINLLSNAKHALKNSGNPKKRITLRAKQNADHAYIMQVEDNGIGISRDNMTKIFTHGFTTKKDGHGFGLHSCALSAKELGASLSADSSGYGHGATFTITLPVAASKNGSTR